MCTPRPIYRPFRVTTVIAMHYYTHTLHYVNYTAIKDISPIYRPLRVIIFIKSLSLPLTLVSKGQRIYSWRQGLLCQCCSSNFAETKWRKEIYRPLRVIIFMKSLSLPLILFWKGQRIYIWRQGLLWQCSSSNFAESKWRKEVSSKNCPFI